MPLRLELQRVNAGMWGLGSKPGSLGSLEEQEALVTAESALQQLIFI